MFQVLSDLTIGAGWTVARTARRVSEVVTRFHDPLVKYRLHGRVLLVPLSHALPLVRRELPLYSDNLRRLAAFLRETFGRLVMVDVGANVGDSWATAGPAAGDAYLLVEGSPRFFSILARNAAAEPGVVCVQALLSDRAGEVEGELVLDHGNATVMQGKGQARTGRPAGPPSALRLETLDAVLADHPGFGDAALVKVDAEGFDRRVLLGGRSLLEGRGPAILFEHNPRDLALAGEDDRAIFRDLGALGYARFLFYDHRGHLVGATEGADEAWVENLLRYARHQAHFYYDVVAFHGRDCRSGDGGGSGGNGGIAAAFLAREREFFAARD